MVTINIFNQRQYLKQNMCVYLALWIVLFASARCTEDDKFTSVPTTVKTFENETVLLPCYYNHMESHIRVKWWKGEQLLGNSHDPHHLLPDRVRMWANYSLQISDLKPSDTGEYTCELVRPEPWSSIKQVHSIEVQYPPIVKTIPEEGFLEVKKGEFVDIGCEVSGTPKPVINWLKNGEPMALLDHRSRIRFKAESRHLGGVYECIATNGLRDPVKASIRVQVQDAPTVVARRAWVHSAPGLRAELEAELRASAPPASTAWFRQGRPVHPDNRVHIVDRDGVHRLVFRNVRASDLGDYTFRAENKLGMADVSFRLSGAPNVASFKVDPALNKPTATDFTLVWDVDSYSTIIEYNLWLRPYVPRATQSPPAAPTAPATSPGLESAPGPSWSKIVVPAGDTSNGPIHSVSYVVHGLTPSTVYEALVISRNSFGWSKLSSILHFATEPNLHAKPSTSDYSESQTPLVLEEILEDNSSNTTGQLSSFKKDEDSENLAARIETSFFFILPLALSVFGLII